MIKNCQVVNMIVTKYDRYLVLLLLGLVFLYMMSTSIFKWTQGKVGETQSNKKASDMLYPSVTLLPFYEMNNSLAKLSSFKNIKNLTEYYSKTSYIKKDIISIQQTYETGNG